MKATHKIVEGKTNRLIANESLKAMSSICGYSNGTISEPFELASSRMEDGRTLIQTILEDGFVRFNDGWYIVEADEYTIYVDVTSFALKEMGNPEYKIIDTVNV